MAGITFSGLASGIDTDAIVTQLIELERQPITRLENDKSYLNSRLSAFSAFEEKLNALKSVFEDLDTSDELRSYSATTASEEYFTVTASSSADAGSYDIEVINLAQVQKDVSIGYASSSEENFTAGTVTINGIDIAIGDGDSLGTIVDKINEANGGETPTGVSAALINDGTTNGYRIVLSGDDASTTITASASGVSADGVALSFSTTQPAQQASINVDGINIVSDNNTISGALPGVTLTLLKPNITGETTHLGVDVDAEAVKEKIEAFATAYNDIVNFIGEQKESSWANDSGLQSPRRRLQSFLSTTIGVSGSFQSLVAIGAKTNKDDGTISFDSAKLNDAIANDLESVEKLFLGEDGVEGIAEKFTSYLDGITDSADGIYASRKKSTESSIRSIDEQIERIELRLEKREQIMREQFYNLELLMSQMNSTSNYLSQQMTMLNSMSSGGDN